MTTFEAKMKLFKLIVHQKNFSAEDLIINPKDFPLIKKGNIVEIYNPEGEFSRLLLQVTSFKEDLQGKETISIEQSIATTFQLKTYSDVVVNIVSPEDVALDSVELTFKDQYLGRSDMWRLKNSLVNTCVYLNKKIEFCGGTIRCQVYEMWSMGDRVACGVITDDTKVVFRSSTSMVYLFIQMSSEMWDFDIHGDLYFEKAVNGFLAELFQKWKKNGSNHEVTIVLFSRTFYKATNLEEFPHHMRECLQLDYKGRFYEDFYRVAVQNERYDDWSNTLIQLRKLFTDYQNIVLEYHKRPNIEIPKAVNSTAAQGNFLEVLNMSLNVFEKHYLDRSFDRTGQLSVVITPGVGVFEVDRELTNVTKQRIIDNGVGSDLVCVGEQPLHAVPLFKFHNKDSFMSAVDDYSMPHWINLSFYSSNKKVGYSNFIPRIKLPPKLSKVPKLENDVIGKNKNKLSGSDNDEDDLYSNICDFDAYDAQVFQIPSGPSSRFSRSPQRMSGRRSHGGSDTLLSGQKPIRRKLSDPDLRQLELVGSPNSNTLRSSPSSPGDMPRRALGNISPTSPTNGRLKRGYSNGDEENSPPPSTTPGQRTAGRGSATIHSERTSVGNMPPLMRPGRALINPFDPSHVTIKLTSNRRRWTHIFPKGPTGVLIQQHHYQAVPAGHGTDTEFPEPWDCVGDEGHFFADGGPPTPLPVSTAKATPPPRNNSFANFIEHIASLVSGSTKSSMAVDPPPGNIDKHRSNSRGHITTPGVSKSVPHPTVSMPPAQQQSPSGGINKSLTLLWGATGEQEWTPALTTGVDWKSLTIPACLPITTDYFPDIKSLVNDYVVSNYNLLPDHVSADYAQQRAVYRKPLSTVEVFKELVSQRLAQGFQLIVESKPLKGGSSATSRSTSASTASPNLSPSRPMATGRVSITSKSGRAQDMEPSEEYRLSIGRIFHRISLCGPTISVTRYRPRHPYPPFNYHYRYRFQAPHHDTYEVSWVSFTTEKLENYNWNFLDHYICTRGDTDFALGHTLKYWRFRVYLLPIALQATKKILDGSEHCDLYGPLCLEEQCHMVEGFLKFMETWVNKIRRINASKKQRSPAVPMCCKIRRGSQGYISPPLYLPLTQVQGCATVVGSPQSSNTQQQTSVVGSSPFRERLGSNRMTDKPRPRSGSKVMERVKTEGSGSGSGRVSPASEAVGDGSKTTASTPGAGAGLTPTSLSMDLQMDSASHSDVPGNDDSGSQGSGSGSEIRRLRSTATNAEILEAMKAPSPGGVGFISQHPGLPSMTFVSADMVLWLMAHVEGVDTSAKAVAIAEKMIQEDQLICHASGDFSLPFIVGFYLYHVVQQEKDAQKDPDYVPPLGCHESFVNEWIEVEVKHPNDWKQVPTSATNSAAGTPAGNNSSSSPVSTDSSPPPIASSSGQQSQPYSPNPAQLLKFLANTLEQACREEEKERTLSVYSYKKTHLEVDVNCKSDRIEWGHARYQSIYRPDRAYELVVQWVNATGSIVAELIHGLARKGQVCGIQMVPIPADPFALPFTHKSDPLRGPIFIPLDVESLMGNKSYLFEEFPEDTWDQRLFLFQEAIVTRFGFLPCAIESSPARSNSSRTRSSTPSSVPAPTPNAMPILSHHHHQYIHLTGNAFILIPSEPCPHHTDSGPTNLSQTMGNRYLSHEVVASPHEEYITRHVSGKNKDDCGPERRMGFLWSWNHMISRRWKSSTTPAMGDEAFQVKLLKDFRAFCANTDNRLKIFWESCWSMKDSLSAVN
ncbi:GATOR complex protein Iml1 isoform X2 [Ischnura elegans]|uniref:GATOR complex protein Iml1 isoform X2 n=1 Tax=Ischnura elegans TaxID=197161 RepID=UPI001ED8B59A|nr:GATOR complex protein Iml1 isoform X2 [Ischnura elegans]